MHVDLLPLALAAIEDADARLVLADAIEENGWWDERAWAVLPLIPWGSDGARRWIALPDAPRAFAGVLLFGAWSTEMWPAADQAGAGRRTRELWSETEVE